MIFSVIIFFLGAFLLYLGAEGLVRGSIHISKTFGIRPIIIGLTVVAFGTSAPEFIVSLISTIAGSSDIALGNVVGSNIANIGLILGIAALLRPVDVSTRTLIIYYPVLILSSGLLYIFALGEVIGFYHGAFLFSGIVLFTGYLIRNTRAIPDGGVTNRQRGEKHVKSLNIIFIIGGAGLLVGGSHLMVNSGITIAREIGISEFAIGITLVAVGTSLPELAATIVAVMKKSTGIILGNIIGSNIFNVLFVIGGVSMIQPISVEPSSRFYEFPIMIVFSLVLFIFMQTRFIINRIEGFLLLAGYITFIVFIF
jgi:cation:H+ antiporter